MKLILASGSSARRTMLENAWLAFTAIPSTFDEDTAKLAWAGAHAGLAQSLAAGKARDVSARYPGALVIGADQILVCEGQRFSKPAGLAGAAAQLRALRGHAHDLVTAVCVVRDGLVLWQQTSVPRLAMRDVSDDFISHYLASEGEAICACVGAYRLEGRGIQLFDTVEGDYFSILGMPLLALLTFLRQAMALD